MSQTFVDGNSLMPANSDDIKKLMWQLAQLCRQQAEQQAKALQAYADPTLASPAQYGEVVAEQVHWWPTAMDEPLDFSDLERGVELKLHPAVKDFYSSLWGADLAVQHPRGAADLLLLWHQADFERLQHNLIGHILMKRRLKQRETLFFAVTDEEDMMLSVLNSTGEVYLEQAGREVHQLVAPDLASFLAALTPR